MKNKIIAYMLGITCHIFFAAAISVMAYMLFEGLTMSVFSFGDYGRILNIILLLQFPIFHSFFLSSKGRRLLEMPFPKDIAKDLVTTTFSLLSSLQLLLVFLLWTPDQEIWFAPTGLLFSLWACAYLLSWVFLAVALHEAGMAMHTGSLGWRAVVSGVKPKYPSLRKQGLHGQCRHPIYLAFSCIILTAPVWSFDHFILAIVWVAYCLIGPLFKEQRLSKFLKQDYRMYQKITPYMIPKILLFGSRCLGKMKG